jgi:hypothetical protein
MPLRDLPKIPGPAAPRLLRAPASELKRSPPIPVSIKNRGIYRLERLAQEERVRNARANKRKRKGF